MTSVTKDKTESWCKQRLGRLNGQNKDLRRKLRDIEKRVQAYKTKERDLASDLDALKGKSTIKTTSLLMKRPTDFKIGGRAAFLGIAHHVDAVRPVPSERSQHKTIPRKILRQIEKEDKLILKLSSLLKERNRVLRKTEMECQKVELECRDEMEKIADIVGKQVLHSILLDSPSQDMIQGGAAARSPIDPSLRLVNRGEWK